MTPEQAAAYINAQTVMMTAQMETMKVENAESIDLGQGRVHGADEWRNFTEDWEVTIGHNAVIQLFNDTH